MSAERTVVTNPGAFCNKCFEPAKFEVALTPSLLQQGIEGFWWHEATTNPKICTRTNWLKGICFDADEAAQRRAVLSRKVVELTDKLSYGRRVRIITPG